MSDRRRHPRRCTHGNLRTDPETHMGESRDGKSLASEICNRYPAATNRGRDA